MTGQAAINSVLMERSMTRTALGHLLGHINGSRVSSTLNGNRMRMGMFIKYMDVLGYSTYVQDDSGWERQLDAENGGPILKERMHECGVSQMSVAEKIDASQTSVSHHLCRQMQVSTLVRIASALGCRVVARNDDGDEILIDG